MIQRKPIDERLFNWARWCMANAGRGADCMTGAICEGLRKAALGSVWSGHDVRDKIDDGDAVKVELAMRKVTLQQRLLLSWCYVERAPQDVICRKLSIPRRPISEYEDRLLAAQEAIEDIVDGGNG